MSTEQENRLTQANRRLLDEITYVGQRINALEKFVRRLLHPEDFGHAVTHEVRQEAARLLPDTASKGGE